MTQIFLGQTQPYPEEVLWIMEGPSWLWGLGCFRISREVQT